MKNIAKGLNLDFLENLPKVKCVQCQKIYRGYENNFICFSCKERNKIMIDIATKKEKRIKYLLDNSNIPKRYKLANFEPKNQIQKIVSEYLINNFYENKTSSDTLFFGAIGTGKTYISCAFAKDLIKRIEKNVKYITEYRLLNLYFQKDYRLFKNFRDAEILILDEIGKRELIDWQMIQLEELLSYRFDEMLPTIYITNLTDSNFKTFLGDRLTDRLRESNIQRFAFNGDSFRGK